MESRWPLLLVIALLCCVGAAIVVGSMWLVEISSLPGIVKSSIEILLLGFLIPGARAANRRTRDGRNPWSKARPDRG